MISPLLLLHTPCSSRSYVRGGGGGGGNDLAPLRKLLLLRLQLRAAAANAAAKKCEDEDGGGGDMTVWKASIGGNDSWALPTATLLLAKQPKPRSPGLYDDDVKGFTTTTTTIGGFWQKLASVSLAETNRLVTNCCAA